MGHGIARNGISSSLYKGSMGCLREKFRLPNRNSVEDLYFKIFKGYVFVSGKEKR